MKETIIYYGLRALPICAAVLTFVLIWVLYGTWQPHRRILTTYQELKGLLREKEQQSSRYQRLEKWLLQNGAGFHYGMWMTPNKFLGTRFVLATAGMVVITPFSLELGLAACVLLFFLPSWLLLYLNSKDNEKLLPELKLVYHAIELQIRAGVYVTDALVECCGSVREKRLHTALLELAGDVTVRADIYDALNKFQSKFDNRYVDTLCITILQALESGHAVELLGDIGDQIKDMEQAVLERKKGALDRSITFYQLGVLSVVLAIALFACVTYMFGAAAGL